MNIKVDLNSQMNVLILHQVGDPGLQIEATRSLVYMIPELKNNLNSVVHNTYLKFPDYLKSVNFGLIVLGPTFLSNRHASSMLERVKKEYAFIKSSNACKIALPQDDYDSHKVLDDWLIDWGVDRVYSCLAPKYWPLLYPKYHKFGDLKTGYTSYISDEWIERWSKPKKHENRTIDISYRCFAGARYNCSMRNLKFSIANRFISALDDFHPNNNLNLDISTEQKDIIPGDQWHDFIENSRFCLATPSGSSVLDPYGEIQKQVLEFIRDHPNANFEDVKKQCLESVDGKYQLTAVSPRNIEAALGETVQIATLGHYSGIMVNGEHYVLLKEDCSNISEVIEMMEDKGYINRIKNACKAAFLDEPRLRRINIVNEIIAFAEDNLSKRNEVIRVDLNDIELLNNYYNDIKYISKKHFIKKRVNDFFYETAIKFGALRAKRFVRSLNIFK